MKRIAVAVLIITMLVSQNFVLSGAQMGQQTETTENVITLNATVEQLAWMAYGAPVKTFNALGCTDEAQGFAATLGTVKTIRLISSIGIAGGMLLAFLDPGDAGFPLGITLTVISSLGSTAASVIESAARGNAKSQIESLAVKHMNGEETCIAR